MRRIAIARFLRGLVLSAGAAALLLGLSACRPGTGPLSVPGFVTGGGWLPSADKIPGDHANFGLVGEQCDLNQPPTGHFNYHDIADPAYEGGVKMNGTLADATKCVSGSPGFVTNACHVCAAIKGIVPPGVSPEGVYGLDVNYRSTNPKCPGIGAAVVCVVDGGEGFNATADAAAVRVQTGPFAGYSNEGEVQGNIQAHLCS